MSEVPKTRSTELPEAPFGRVVTAMITPVKPAAELTLADQEEREKAYKQNFHQPVDYVAAQELAVWLAKKGSEGLAIAGTTGESPTLTHEEQRTLFREVADASVVPLVAGVGSNSTLEAVSLTEFVSQNELAKALLVVSPYYNRPGQAGIEDYFGHIATATNLPIIIYDIPKRTGQGIDNETILRLAQRYVNIRGLKDARGNPDYTAKLAQHPDLPSDFFIYSGDDGLNYELTTGPVKAVGAISVASHWAGVELGHMYGAIERGNLDHALAIDKRLRPSYEFETSAGDERNPLPTRAMLRAIGRPAVGYGRSPMVLRSITDEDMLEQRALRVYTDLQSYTN